MPAFSFKNELARYRGPHHGHDLLKRLNSDHRVEDIWQKFQQSTRRQIRPAALAAELIRLILDCERGSKDVEKWTEFHRRQSEDFLARKKKAAKAHYYGELEAAVSQLPIVRSEVLHDPRNGRSQATRPGLIVVIERSPSETLGRKNQNNSRSRKYFMLRMGTYFHQNCGLWLDNEVAALTDIAFNLPSGRTTTNQVRLGRRPSTKAGRAKKR
jgi:hypothetical protein